MSSVVHPSHYNQGSIECIDAIRSSLGDSGFQNFLVGNCMKYLWRFDSKNGLEDLEKCKYYLEMLIDSFSDTFNVKSQDGHILKVGQRVYGHDNLAWKIIKISKDNEIYPIVAVNDIKGQRDLKPEWVRIDLKNPDSEKQK